MSARDRCATPGKVRYPTAWAAGRAMSHQMGKFKAPTGFYQCGDHWHLTSKARR